VDTLQKVSQLDVRLHDPLTKLADAWLHVAVNATHCHLLPKMSTGARPRASASGLTVFRSHCESTPYPRAAHRMKSRKLIMYTLPGQCLQATCDDIDLHQPVVHVCSLLGNVAPPNSGGAFTRDPCLQDAQQQDNAQALVEPEAKVSGAGSSAA
jgi:hypothetical protein